MTIQTPSTALEVGDAQSAQETRKPSNQGDSAAGDTTVWVPAKQGTSRPLFLYAIIGILSAAVAGLVFVVVMQARARK